MVGPKPKPIKERFWALVKHGASNDCWLWMAKKSGGYGQFQIGSRTDNSRRLIYAHRLAYEWTRGPILAGLELDHLCRTRACVNPHHLEPVTGRVNILRGVGIAAINATKTHCKRGHLLSDNNIFPYAKRLNVRACRTCHIMRYYGLLPKEERADPSRTFY